MAGPILSLSYTLHVTPQPTIMRGIGAFERALKGSLQRVEEEVTALPIKLTDASKEHILTISAEAFDVTNTPLTRIDRFGTTAQSLANQFVSLTPRLSPQEIELKALLRVPVPDATRSLGGYAVASFTWPRKLELRPEELGKDYFLPTESGMVRLRLSVHQIAKGHELVLMFSNKHDRVTADPEVLEQAYALCLGGIRNIVNNLASPAYQRALVALIGTPK